MRRVHTANSPAEAHLIKGLLASHGIEAVVEGEMLFGALGEVGMSMSVMPAVSVADADAERAVDIIQKREPGAPSDAETEPEDCQEDQ